MTVNLTVGAKAKCHLISHIFIKIHITLHVNNLHNILELVKAFIKIREFLNSLANMSSGDGKRTVLPRSLACLEIS